MRGGGRGRGCLEPWPGAGRGERQGVAAAAGDRLGPAELLPQILRLLIVAQQGTTCVCVCVCASGVSECVCVCASVLISSPQGVQVVQTALEGGALTTCFPGRARLWVSGYAQDTHGPTVPGQPNHGPPLTSKPVNSHAPP